MSETRKVCKGPCGEEKPLAEFSPSRVFKQDGHRNICKACEAAKQVNGKALRLTDTQVKVLRLLKQNGLRLDALEERVLHARRVLPALMALGLVDLDAVGFYSVTLKGACSIPCRNQLFALRLQGIAAKGDAMAAR